LSPYKKEISQLVSINGTNFYVETAGKGKALLLIHAGVGDSRMWDKQFDEFSKSHYVIRCDLRGFGQSKMSPGSFAHHKDIASLLEHLEVEKAVVIGASFGGYVAINFALTYPELITALLLVAPALDGYKFKSTEMLNFFAREDDLLESGDLISATELNIKMWVAGPQRSVEEVNHKVREQVREMQMNIFAQPEIDGAEEIELTPPAIKRLSEIEIPTIVINGNLDVIEFQEISSFLAKIIKNAKRTIMPRVAHLPNMESPDEFNQIVLDFVK